MNKSIVLNLLYALSLGVFAQEPLRPYVGTSDFRELTGEGMLFVDKTLLVKDLLSQKKKVVLITRPRRWGKSVNMNMLKYFFKEEVNPQGQRLEPQPYRYLFENLKISKEPGLIEQFQGQYPTVLITLKDIEKRTYPEMQRALESAIVDLFSEYKYVRPISHWWKESGEREDLFLDMIHEKVIRNKSIGFEKSLRTLSKWLHQHHGENVFILIDEYDTPLNSASEYGYAQEAVKVIKSVLAPALKDNPYLEKGILTGILRVAGVNLFSGMNGFIEDSVLSNHYSAYYGFTEEEVDQLLIKAQRDNKTEVKEWYNGYAIGGQVIYNPWSIVHYLSIGKTEPYWLRSGTTQLIERAMVSDNIQQDLSVLRSGQVLSRTFKKDIDFFNFVEDSSALWPLLLYAGYLTATNCQFNSALKTYACDVRIPNEEISFAYSDFLSNLLISKNLPKLEKLDDVNEIFEAIAQQNAPKVTKLLTGHEFIPFSEEWNFNFLQLAILSGNRDVFQAVYDNYQDTDSLGMKSRDGLSVTDFAFMAGVNYAELEGIHRGLENPKFIENFCKINLAVVGGALGFLGTVYAQHHSGKPPVKSKQTPWYRLTKAIGLALAPVGGAIGYAAEQIGPSWCDRYNKFQAIDISQPRLMSTWVQFAKFMDQDSRSYFQIGSSCRAGDKQILSLKKSPFQIPLFSVKPIVFSLCTASEKVTENKQTDL